VRLRGRAMFADRYGMEALVPDPSPMPRGIDPKVTEVYLLHCLEVLDASVIWHDGALRAFVTVKAD